MSRDLIHGYLEHPGSHSAGIPGCRCAIARHPVFGDFCAIGVRRPVTMTAQLAALLDRGPSDPRYAVESWARRARLRPRPACAQLCTSLDRQRTSVNPPLLVSVGLLCPRKPAGRL